MVVAEVGQGGPCEESQEVGEVVGSLRNHLWFAGWIIYVA